MARFNPTRAFKQIRAESQREKDAIAEASRKKHEEWAAQGRRSAAFNQLMNLFPSESAGTVDVQRVTAQMVEYGQTLPVKWVKGRVELVRVRMAKLAADGIPVRDAGLKEILLNLLLFANPANHGKVAEIFNEALGGDPLDVETFRLCLVNWLADKVVDGWPPLPDELKKPDEACEEVAEGESLDGQSNTAAKEEWLPASEAIQRAEQSGRRITLKWLTQNASKHGVRIRPRQQPGRHKQEVEWSSLAGYLLKPAPPEKELDEKATDRRIRKAQELKRKELSLT